MGHRISKICFVTALACFLAVQTGCRNRGTYFANNSFAPLAGPTTVAPPNTYTLQIPGQPNLNQSTGIRQATNIPTVNPRNGWQPAGTKNTNASTPTTNNNNTTNSINGQSSTSVSPSTNSTIINQTSVVPVTPSNASAQLPIAGNQVAQNPGLSFTDATNFRTTAVDERLDQSRLPVTDASQVRAPTHFSPSTTVGQFNAPYYVPGRQPIANSTPQRFAANPQSRQPAINPYPNLNRNGVPTTIVGTFGQPTFARPAPQAYAGANTRNQVLGQSTVYADPTNDPNFQNGWRNRELTASRDSFNR